MLGGFISWVGREGIGYLGGGNDKNNGHLEPADRARIFAGCGPFLTFMGRMEPEPSKPMVSGHAACIRPAGNNTGNAGRVSKLPFILHPCFGPSVKTGRSGGLL